MSLISLTTNEKAQIVSLLELVETLVGELEKKDNPGYSSDEIEAIARGLGTTLESIRKADKGVKKEDLSKFLASLKRAKEIPPSDATLDPDEIGYIPHGIGFGGKAGIDYGNPPMYIKILRELYKRLV
ncbi:hypothetical protein TWF730_008737 [Orbilia blumenaviensis]|uniref:Uncharacterized protein n=1 Tax=Orbilia blumenaviensis TaxID=1796055 RepID=A0AAV9V420_9PEZI